MNSIAMRIFLTAALASHIFAANHPKVLIIYDMEGVSGVTNPNQTRYSKPDDYAVGRKFLTSDVNAAIRGLAAGGAGPIWIQDGHGSGNTESPDILLDQMDKRATFDFRPYPFNAYTTGLDGSIDAIACIGMHARAGGPGFEAHTFNFEVAYQVNGVDFTETHIVAQSAARWGIPVIMVSGDNVLGEELRPDFPDLEYAVVKTAKSRGVAEPFPQDEVQRRIEASARVAMQKFLDGKYRPYYLPPPYHYVVSFRNAEQAAAAARFPQVERDGDHAVRFSSPTYIDGYNLAAIMFGAGNDRLPVLVRLLNSDPQGKKFLEEWDESFWQRFVDSDSAPEWTKSKGNPRPRKKQYYGAQ